MPNVGPVAATADLEASDPGTRLRLRWAYQGSSPADSAAIERYRIEREAAYDRLAAVVGSALPVLAQEETVP